MAVLPIYPYDARVLREDTREISGPSPELTQLIIDMFETMDKASGVGLAANQVGEGKSLFVIDLRPVDGYEDSSPLVFINPKILDMWGEEIGYDEGCLSVPNVREEIFRPERLAISYRDANFEPQEMEVDEFLSRVIQHEYDHLEGIFFTDYLRGLRKRLLMPALKKIRSGEGDADYTMARKVELVV